MESKSDDTPLKRYVKTATILKPVEFRVLFATIEQCLEKITENTAKVEDRLSCKNGF